MHVADGIETVDWSSAKSPRNSAPSRFRCGAKPRINVPFTNNSTATKVTTNMCGTLPPDGGAQTSSRPVFSASR
jgi:hypothetical protein